MTSKPTVEQQVAERFRLDVAQHKLTVLHEDDLYRHLRFMDPESSHHWFDLVTWPGTLTIRGDMGSYTFSRTKDMLDFFRRSAWDGGPNLQYWEEKLDAADTRAGVRKYSEELLRQHITDDLAALADDDLTERLRVRAEELGTTSDHLPPAVADECRAASAAYMAGLREELDDDLTGDFPTWCIEDESDALAAVRQFEYRPDGEEPFTFDSEEWQVRDWAWHYAWCCHAIVWGIAAYNRARAEKPAPALTAAATAEHADDQPQPVLVAAGAEETTQPMTVPNRIDWCEVCGDHFTAWCPGCAACSCVTGCDTGCPRQTRPATEETTR